ncbi:TIGR00730 family Rossman fold protein [bacterium]|nr:TIGR00730 family Rossman fold protein [bacterium]
MSKKQSDYFNKEKQVQLILESPTYKRADQDIEYLARDELRSCRLQLEFLKPELILEETGIQSTIVVFGGSRIVQPSIAKLMVNQTWKTLKKDPKNPDLKKRHAIAKRILAKSHYYEIAREFGRIVGKSGQGHEDCLLVIMTGGGPGLMEAANRGASEVGAKTVGLNITLPIEQRPNPYITPELCFQFRYFALRKMHFLLRAKALVVFPGGFGTFDEMFEIMTLVQTQKVDPLPIVLVGEKYWRSAFNAQFLVDEGTIDAEDTNLFWYAENAQEIWHGILRWYKERNKSLFPGDDKKDSTE